MKGLNDEDGAAPQATSPYLNCAPRSPAVVAAKYLELAAQERRAIEALEAEIAQRKTAERSYLARAATLTGFEKPSGGSGWLPTAPPAEWIEAMAQAITETLEADDREVDSVGALRIARAAYAALARQMGDGDAE